ncbi:MAG: hypothetical protein IT359_17765 [Gemmatimonadaceae bacterium]|nr:hypothetical protein [Gemmatimonadaceae bacterium]
MSHPTIYSSSSLPVSGAAHGGELQGDVGGVVQDAVREAVRDAVNDARAAAQGAPAPAAPVVASPQASQAMIDAITAQMTAERVAIDKLTQQLVPGLSDAKENAITEQLQAAQQRLSSLQVQLDMARGGPPATIAGTTAPPPPPDVEVIPREAVAMTAMFFTTVAVVAIGVPLARAFARWLDRRGARPSPAIPADLAQRLDRLEQGVDAIAIEVERVSEGQRFTNKLMSEMRALPAPNAMEQWPQGAQKEAIPVDRRAGG